MAAVAICLSKAGWLTGVIEKLDVLLSDFLTSQYSQTELYPQGVASFVWLTAEHGDNPTVMTEQTKLVVERYLTPYFDTVVVETKHVFENPNDLTGYTVEIYINVTQNGVAYDTRQLFTLRDGKFKKVIGASNAT